MKVTIITANKLDVDVNQVITNQPVLNDDSDIVIVNSDDYFDDKLFDQLRRLKKKYLGLFVIGFNDPELLMYNKQYVDFCFDHNINFLDYDQDKESLQTYLDNNLVFNADYTKFAKYYLQLQPEIDYHNWFGNEDFRDKRVVDLGCGVPHYLSTLKPQSYLGFDLSAEMIRRAQLAYPDYDFVVNDITTVDFQADVVISILDVINYLPSLEDVIAVFTNVYRNLSPNGMFIFDVHHKSVLRAFNNYFDFEEDEKEQFIWESSVKQHQLTHYFQIVDENYKVYVEKHHQQYYDIQLIRKHLTNIGFVIVSDTEAYNHHIIKCIKKETDE